MSNSNTAITHDDMCIDEIISISVDSTSTISSVNKDTAFDKAIPNTPQVSFSLSSTVYHIPVELGDHPACFEGPPLQLANTSNEVVLATYEPVCFDKLGNTKDFKSLSAMKRWGILRKLGYSDDQMHEAICLVENIQEMRCRTLLEVLDTSIGPTDGHYPLSKRERAWIERVVLPNKSDSRDADESVSQSSIFPAFLRSKSDDTALLSFTAGDIGKNLGKAVFGRFKKLVKPLSNTSASMPLPSQKNHSVSARSA